MYLGHGPQQNKQIKKRPPFWDLELINLTSTMVAYKHGSSTPNHSRRVYPSCPRPQTRDGRQAPQTSSWAAEDTDLDAAASFLVGASNRGGDTLGMVEWRAGQESTRTIRQLPVVLQGPLMMVQNVPGG